MIESIRAVLTATGAFDAVRVSAPPEDWGQSAGALRLAVVEPVGWSEIDERDDPSAVQSDRELSWNVTIHVRDEDPLIRDRECDRLASVVQNALSGVSLAGLTLPGLTRCGGRGRWLRAEPPERRLVVSGLATYFVDGFDGHNEDE